MRRLAVFLVAMALLTVGLIAPASAKKPIKDPPSPPSPPSLGSYQVTTFDAGDGCFFRLTYDVNGSGRKAFLEYTINFVTDPAWDGSWSYPEMLTSPVRRNTSTVAFPLPTGEAVGWEFDRTVEVGWTVELFSGKKNPVLVGEDSGSASVNVPHSGGDPCTLGT